MNTLADILYVLRDHKEFLDRDENLKFFDFCYKLNNMKSHLGQNFQAAWVLFELNKKYDDFNFWCNEEDFFYVDFGGADPLYMSNTHPMRSLEWKGIVAEPNPVWWDKWIQLNDKNISFSTKCVSDVTGESVPFLCTKDPLHSTLEEFQFSDYNAPERKEGKLVNVETITLYELLNIHDAPKDITYLSIDTEGSELSILEKFFKDNTKYNIELITVEHNFDAAHRPGLYKLLTENGYKRKFESFSRWDDFYIREVN